MYRSNQLLKVVEEGSIVTAGDTSVLPHFAAPRRGRLCIQQAEREWSAICACALMVHVNSGSVADAKQKRIHTHRGKCATGTGPSDPHPCKPMGHFLAYSHFREFIHSDVPNTHTCTNKGIVATALLQARYVRTYIPTWKHPPHM